MKIKLLLFLFLYAAYTAPAQNQFFNAFKVAETEWKKSKENYLSLLLTLENIEEDSLKKFEKSIYYEALFTYHSFLGDYANTMHFDELRRKTSRFKTNRDLVPDTLFDQDNFATPALEYIISAADQHPVIMINEGHHVPFHRNFVHALLQPLRKKGFKYLALETLFHDAKINACGYPVFEDGYYLREPLYAEMIRAAVQLGYTLVPYESEEKCDSKGKDKYYCDRLRDSTMAIHLSQIIQQDEQAKILVLAGYSHIKESGRPQKPRMAEYFRRLTNIDPLTIDQANMNDYLDPSLDHRFYLHAQKRYPFQEPTIFLKNGQPWSFTSAIDITLFSPPPVFENGRATFYSIYGKRQKINVNKWNIEEPYFVQAFYRKEKGNNIPADQTLIRTGKESLYLFPGKYELRFLDRRGALMKRKKIKVR